MLVCSSFECVNVYVQTVASSEAKARCSICKSAQYEMPLGKNICCLFALSNNHQSAKRDLSLYSLILIQRINSILAL